MRSMIASCFLISALTGFSAAAQAAVVEIRITPTRSLEIHCTQSSKTHVFQGASDDFKVLRVGDSVVSYEIYRGDFLIASCQDIFVD